MRIFFTTLLVCAFFGAGAQSFDSAKLYRSQDYGWQYKRVKIDSILKLPNGVIINRSWQFPVTDTSSLSSRINDRVKYSDTAAMLLPYYKASNPASYITAAAITGKVNISDTAAMLSGYQSAIGLKAAKATTLTINGTGFDLSANRSWTIATTDTSSLSNRINTKQNILTNPITGTGTSGQIAYWNGTSTQTGSATLTYTPTSTFLLNNTVTASSGIARGEYKTSTLTAAANSDTLVNTDMKGTFVNGAFTGVQNIALRTQISSATGSYNIYSSGTAANYFNGRILLGSSVDDGTNKLQVTGSSTLTGKTTIAGSTTVVSGIASGLQVNPTLVATGNSNTLVGLDVFPTYTNGAYTGVNNYDIRLGRNVGGTDRFLYLSSPDGTGKATITTNNQTLVINAGYNGLRFAYANTEIIVLNSSGLLPLSGDTYDLGTSVQRYREVYSFYTNAQSYKLNSTIVMSYSTVPNTGIFFDLTNNYLKFYNNGTQAAQLFNTGNLVLQNGGTFTDITSARLQINSTTQGFLQPRMTTTQKLAIGTPAEGLMVYDLTLHKLCVYTGSAWETITSL